MYKCYDVTLDFLGSPTDIMNKVYPLIDPEFPCNLVNMTKFLKKLNIEPPKEGIKIHGYDGYNDYFDHLTFAIEIDKKEDEMAALDFIHEIYKKVYNKIGEFKDMEVNLIIRIYHRSLYHKEGK